MSEPQRPDLRGITRTQPPPRAAPPSVLAADDDATAAAAVLDLRRDEWQQAVPRRFWSARPSDLPEPIAGELATWAAADERTNLVLYGPVGVGKTHAAIAACRSPFGAGASMLFMPVGELLDRLDWRRPDSVGWMAEVISTDLLIVDDLGAERSNEWTGERLYLVMNRRWLDGRPTIVTTNLSTTALTDVVGERTYSRLAHGALALQMTGKDHRRG